MRPQVTRGGDLVVSFVQHAAVRRSVKNPFEDGKVVGITNYIDVGLRLAAPLARERAAAAAGGASACLLCIVCVCCADALRAAGPAFELAAAWQARAIACARAQLITCLNVLVPFSPLFRSIRTGWPRLKLAAT
jgi:hypothetical protein